MEASAQGGPAQPGGTPPPPPEAPDVAAIEAKVRADLEQEFRQELADKLAAASGQPQAAAIAPKVDLSGQEQAERAEAFKEWPSTQPSELPQPWDLRSLNLHKEDVEPGKPDTVSPIVISHSYPVLTSGSADPAVHELGRLLHKLGFENSVSKGENPFGAVDQTIMGAVHAFRSVYHVLEDPTAFGGDTPLGRELAAAHIGPWTWEAVIRAAEKLGARIAKAA